MTSEKVSTFPLRVEIALNERKMTRQSLSEKTGINKGNLSKYVNGIIKPKVDKIELIADILNISTMWLMGYDVPMEHKLTTQDLKQELKDVKFSFYDEIKDFTDAQLNDLKYFIDYLKTKS